jgi:hypothetical protein
MWTEAHEKDLAYGEWHNCTPQELAVENRLYPAERGEEIEPRWSEGVPSRMRRLCGSPDFFKDGVYHRYRPYYRSVDLCWGGVYFLSWLKANKAYLPSAKYSRQWSGVYRLSVEGMTIPRCCGSDTTGTLYVGRGGTGRRNSSILQNRVKALVDGKHEALNNWRCIDLVRKKYPWESLAVQWAFTGRSLNYKAEDVAEAEFAESFLLGSYNEAFGELPPWNLRF